MLVGVHVYPTIVRFVDLTKSMGETFCEYRKGWGLTWYDKSHPMGIREQIINGIQNEMDKK